MYDMEENALERPIQDLHSHATRPTPSAVIKSSRRQSMREIASAINPANWKKDRSKIHKKDMSIQEDFVLDQENVATDPDYTMNTGHVTPRRKKRQGRIFLEDPTIPYTHEEDDDRLLVTAGHSPFSHYTTNKPSEHDTYTSSAAEEMKHIGAAEPRTGDATMSKPPSKKTARRSSMANLRKFLNPEKVSEEIEKQVEHHESSSSNHREQLESHLSPLKRAFKRRSLANLRNVFGNDDARLLSTEELVATNRTDDCVSPRRSASPVNSPTKKTPSRKATARLNKKISNLESQLALARQELAHSLGESEDQPTDCLPPLPPLSNATKSALEAQAVLQSGLTSKKRAREVDDGIEAPSKFQRVKDTGHDEDNGYSKNVNELAQEIENDIGVEKEDERFVTQQPVRRLRKTPSRALMVPKTEINTIEEVDEATPMSRKSFEWPEDVF